MTEEPRVRFQAVLRQAEGKQATGFVVPPDVIERLGGGKRPPVRVTLNGYEYRSTVGVMGGDAMIGVSAAIRDETGLSAGDSIDVELVHDDTPRAVDVSPDFADAMAGVPGTREFFDGLANSLQRFHIDNINAAKAPDTRQRRIDKAVSLFADGKTR